MAKPMFLRSRGEWIAEVTCPTSRPSLFTGHLLALNSMRSPAISMPTSFLVTPAALMRRKASRPMYLPGLSSSTSRSSPTS